MSTALSEVNSAMRFAHRDGWRVVTADGETETIISLGLFVGGELVSIQDGVTLPKDSAVAPLWQMYFQYAGLLLNCGQAVPNSSIRPTDGWATEGKSVMPPGVLLKVEPPASPAALVWELEDLTVWRVIEGRNGMAYQLSNDEIRDL